MLNTYVLTVYNTESAGLCHCCDHEHYSAIEAETCEPARLFVGKMTGFPLDLKSPKEKKTDIKRQALDKLSDVEKKALGLKV